MDASIESPLAALVAALETSETIQTVKRLKATAFEDSTNAALLNEYTRLQGQLQRGMLSGGGASGDDMQRFQQITTLLMVNPDAQAYILSQLKLQQLMAELFQAITGAMGVSLTDMLGQ
ncbi:hypothetical protein AGMMS49992_04370 [Clostridia bacterium]|nr:hypothetical protein AGMMS49992_04370 [Clostridia bacterium]